MFRGSKVMCEGLHMVKGASGVLSANLQMTPELQTTLSFLPGFNFFICHWIVLT